MESLVGDATLLQEIDTCHFPLWIEGSCGGKSADTTLLSTANIETTQLKVLAEERSISNRVSEIPRLGFLTLGSI